MAATFLTNLLAAGAVALTGSLSLPSDVQLVSADCNAAASRVVSQTGGQLLSVSASNKNGRTVCRITVLVPGDGNKRPRKMTVSVPQ